MGKRDELKAQIDALQKQYEAADDDDDLEIGVEKDGHRVSLKGRHARKVLRRLGLDDDDDQGAGNDGQGDGDGDGDGDGKGDGDGDGKGDGQGKDAKPPANHRYFR